MATPAITVSRLGKRYRLGARQETYKTLRESLMGLVKAPLRRLRGSANGDEQQIFWALRDISFTVQQGEVVGIIGRNGAGKSTLLKVLSRITEPTEGEAVIHGRLSALLEVGTGFHPELSGRDNVFLNGTILGMRKAEIRAKFDDIVAFSEVDMFIDTPVKHYSSGMYLRLAFAVAAFLEPDILVVDEVLAVGDAEFQKKCLGKMQDVAGQGRTVLFVSHNMSAVRSLCSKAILLKNGQVAEEGPVVEVCNSYLNQMGDDTTHYDGNLAAEVEVLNANGAPAKTWSVGEEIAVRIRIYSRNEAPLEALAVDLAMYALDGVRLFAAVSDALPETRIESAFRSATYEFRLKNPGFAIPEVYFDVGVRRFSMTGYLGLFRQVRLLAISHLGLPHVAKGNVIVALPNRIAVADVQR